MRLRAIFMAGSLLCEVDFLVITLMVVFNSLSSEFWCLNMCMGLKQAGVPSYCRLCLFGLSIR